MDPDNVARDLYQRYVINTPYSPPRNYSDLLLFVQKNSAPVTIVYDAPIGWDGSVIRDEIYVAFRNTNSDCDHMRNLAHEWAHWLRLSENALTATMCLDDHVFRDYEEEIAVAFADLFEHESPYKAVRTGRDVLDNPTLLHQAILYARAKHRRK